MRTVDKSSPLLSIRLAGNQQTQYRPGDIVTGRISRTQPTTCPRARVTVSIHGESESKIMRSTGLAQPTYLGRFGFFDNRKTTQVVHVDQPLDIKPGSGGASWDFAITIPSSMHPGSVGTSQQYSFLPLSPDKVATQPLPPVFSFSGWKPAQRVTASVQYYLRAELQLPSQMRSKAIETTLPLDVEHFFPGPPAIANFKLRRQIMSQYISSPRLVPGLEDTEPSFSQKAQKFLGSSKVPRITLQAEVDVPTVLQLENVNAVPFRIKIQSRLGTSDIIRDVPQQVKLESLAVRLEPSVEVRCRIPIRNAGFSVSTASEEVNLVAPDAVRKLGKELYIPCTPALSTEGKASSPVDLGEFLGFSLGRQTLKDLRDRGGAQIYPDFTTFNIKHTHLLKWELRGELAGEEIKWGSSIGVTLLPPPGPGDEDKSRRAELPLSGEQLVEMPLSVRSPAELTSSAERPAELSSSSERPTELPASGEGRQELHEQSQERIQVVDGAFTDESFKGLPQEFRHRYEGGE